MQSKNILYLKYSPKMEVEVYIGRELTCLLHNSEHNTTNAQVWGHANFEGCSLKAKLLHSLSQTDPKKPYLQRENIALIFYYWY